jgi:hypothetical protein
LGDRNGYDSALNDLDFNKTQNITKKELNGEKPLENLIKEALNYDSTIYKQALGIDISQRESNGVIKS